VIAALVFLLLAIGNQQVAPIFAKHCVRCHNHELDDGGISFENFDTLRRVVVPGKPDDSALMRAVRWDGDIRMPPGKKLSAREISAIRKWILQGAR